MMNSVDTENNGSHADIATRRRSLKTLLPSTADTESTRWENSFESTRWENFLTVSKIGSKIGAQIRIFWLFQVSFLNNFVKCLAEAKLRC